jgi:sulfhydrogenase subunit beta (sulfur reductase)
MESALQTSPRVIERGALDGLLDALRRRGFTPVGPTVRQGAIVHEELDSADDLPVGFTDVQEGGSYRLERRDDEAVFGHNVGPESWKRLLFPPTLELWRARRAADGGLEVHEDSSERPRYALIGVRSCDLHAIAVQDRVFVDGPWADRDYNARRQDAFIVAVNCGQAAATCFCVSMGTGPRAETGFDLALTELLDGGDHRFFVEVGSERGAEVLDELPSRPAVQGDEQAAERTSERAAAQMGRTLDTTDIRDLLYRNREHPRWDEVADRCLTCGNCTMVCPTCFCSSVDDVTDLAGEEATRTRRWESCFSLEHSYVNGGHVRSSTKARYRQWMTHKLASWIDQFGSSGCIGCGRCITWCPVAIDITEEAAAIRATDGKGHADD